MKKNIQTLLEPKHYKSVRGGTNGNGVEPPKSKTTAEEIKPPKAEGVGDLNG